MQRLLLTAAFFFEPEQRCRLQLFQTIFAERQLRQDAVEIIAAE